MSYLGNKLMYIALLTRAMTEIITAAARTDSAPSFIEPQNDVRRHMRCYRLPKSRERKALIPCNTQIYGGNAF